MFYRLYMECM